MPRLLREIKRAYWQTRADGLPRPASALRDMAVDGKKRLSVWLIPDETYQQDLNLTAVALTIQGGHCENFAYAEVDATVVEDLGLELLATERHTVIPRVNQFHRDVEEPSVEQLAQLTLRLTPQPIIPRRAVAEWIRDYVTSSGFNQRLLPEAIEEKLIEFGFLARFEPHEEAACQDAVRELMRSLNELSEAVSGLILQARENPALEPAVPLQRIKELAEQSSEALSRARRLWRTHPSQPPRS